MLSVLRMFLKQGQEEPPKFSEFEEGKFNLRMTVKSPEYIPQRELSIEFHLGSS